MVDILAVCGSGDIRSGADPRCGKPAASPGRRRAACRRPFCSTRRGWRLRIPHRNRYTTSSAPAQEAERRLWVPQGTTDREDPEAEAREQQGHADDDREERELLGHVAHVER